MDIFTKEGTTVACTPFPAASIELEHRKGFTMAKQKVALTPLEVVFATEDQEYWPGMVIYVNGDCQTHIWAKQVYEMNDQKFILVPVEFVRLVEAKYKQEVGTV